MKHSTIIITLISLFAIVSMGAFTGCDEDGDTTARDLCYKVSDAYCSRIADLDCGTYSSCYNENTESCDAMFDNTCKASAENKQKVDHDIEMIITPKTTCEGLYSIDGFLYDSMTDIAVSCGYTGGLNIGQMCAELITTMCYKYVFDLKCDDTITVAQCTSIWMTQGDIMIDTHACISGEDSTPATTGQAAAFASGKNEIATYTSCGDF